MRYLDYLKNGQQWRFQWQMPLPYFLWEATCPITNNQTCGKNPPTDIERHYACFKLCEPRKLNTLMWIEEPLDASDVPLDHKHFKYVNTDYYKQHRQNANICLRINDGDDNYCKKIYAGMSLDAALSAAQEDAAILLLSSSYAELLDVAYNALHFKHDN